MTESGIADDFNERDRMRTDDQKNAIRVAFKAALTRFEQKHYAAVQFDTEFNIESDYLKVLRMKKQSKVLWDECKKARVDLEAFIEEHL